MPAVNPLKSSVVNPFDQAYAKPGVPPVTVRSIEASLAPQNVGALVEAVRRRGAGSVIVAFVTTVHPLASVTVTLYDPPVNPDIS